MLKTVYIKSMLRYCVKKSTKLVCKQQKNDNRKWTQNIKQNKFVKQNFYVDRFGHISCVNFNIKFFTV